MRRVPPSGAAAASGQELEEDVVPQPPLSRAPSTLSTAAFSDTMPSPTGWQLSAHTSQLLKLPSSCLGDMTPPQRTTPIAGLPLFAPQAERDELGTATAGIGGSYGPLTPSAVLGGAARVHPLADNGSDVRLPPPSPVILAVQECLVR